MLKKINLITLCFIILLFVCGCGKNDKDNNNDNSIEFNEKDLRINGTTKYQIECDEIKDIADLSSMGDYFITKSGELYQLNIYQLFSNDKNCKKVDTDIKVSKFYRNYVLGSDNEIYELNNNSLSLIDETTWRISDIIMIDKTCRPNLLVGGNKIFYYKDKKIYSTKENDKYQYEISDDIAISLDKDEELIYAVDYTIMTTKRILEYTTIITNPECEKYADIKCERKTGWYEVDDDIKKEFSKILFYKGQFIIDKNDGIYWMGP